MGRVHRRKPPKTNLEDERLIVRGVITNQSFIERIRVFYDPGLISSDYNRQIIGWCLDFYEETGKVPGADHILDVFQERTREMDPEAAENLEVALAFLSELSEDSEFNEDYALKRTRDYLNEKKTERLHKELKEAGRHSDISKKLQLIDNFDKIEIVTDMGVNPFTDTQAVSQAFRNLQKPLFTFPGRLGKMLNSQFTRDSLVAFLGREKIGKTWTLMEVGFKALRNRRRVAFFQAGDMSQDQYIRRMGIRCAKVSDSDAYLKELLIPVIDCERNQTCDCDNRPQGNEDPVLEMGEDEEGNPTNVRTFEDFWENEDWEPCMACLRHKAEGDTPEDLKEHREILREFVGSTWYKKRPRVPEKDKLDDFSAVEALQSWAKKYHNTEYRLITTPNYTLSVNQINATLKNWERVDGFRPDVVIIDYPDILAPNDPTMQFRHQQNDTWGSLRALSTTWNCNVTVATQADSSSYTKFLIDLSNFSEDKRKYSHVTAFYGLNQTDEEKKRGIFRINPLMMREDEFDPKSYVTVLQSPQTGQAFLDSF